MIKLIVILLLKPVFLVTIYMKIPSEHLSTEITGKRRNTKSSLLIVPSLRCHKFLDLLSFSTALHNFFFFFLDWHCKKEHIKYWFKYVNAFFFLNTDCQKYSSKDFQKSEKGREVDQCHSTFSHSTFDLYPQRSKNQHKCFTALNSRNPSGKSAWFVKTKSCVIASHTLPPHLHFSSNGRGVQL